jgi:cytochrome c553
MSDPRKTSSEDRRWSLAAGGIVAGVLFFSVVVGVVILPVAQAPNAGISAWTAICRAVGLQPGTPAQRQPRSTAQASPVSQVRWSPETLAILARADARPGAALAAETCANCHGEDGLTVSADFPKLAGQSPQAVYKQLSDYRSGARVHADMTRTAKALTESQLAEVAAYYGHQFAGSALGDAAILAEDDIAILIYRGDPARRMPPCESCHARGVGGPPEAPVLAGQNAQYIERQLRAYKSGQRRNDVYRRMRDIAAGLSDAEIARLARAYQGTY